MIKREAGAARAVAARSLILGMILAAVQVSVPEQAARSKQRASPPSGILPVLSRIPDSIRFTMAGAPSDTVTSVT